MPMKVLVLVANPVDQNHLRVAAESRDIRAAVHQIPGHRLAIVHIGSVRTSDLIDLLQDERPDIVHFAGHGSEDGEVVLENDEGIASPVKRADLTKIFKLLGENAPRCVVFNSCYTLAQ